MKWSQKRFNQKYSTIESTEEYWVAEGCVPCIVVHIKLFCTNGSAQLVLFFILFRVAHAEALKVLNSETQCHTKKQSLSEKWWKHAWVHSLKLSIFSLAAPGSMCQSWNSQLLTAINAIDFWDRCCYSVGFDFQRCVDLSSSGDWRWAVYFLVDESSKIIELVCRINRTNTTTYAILWVLTFQM